MQGMVLSLDSPAAGRSRLVVVSDRNALFTIGELARRTGLSVRTIRFWSDAEIIPPTARSHTGYRLYDVEAVARLDLVRTLRELGMDLPTVQSILKRQATVAQVAAVHAKALDVEIRMLRTRRAVLRSVAQRGSTTEEMTIMHKMAKLSAAERQQLIDQFVDKAFEGIDTEAPGAWIAKGMRSMPSELPDDPTPEQVDAWVELAELLQDEDFQRRCREMAVAGAATETPAVPSDQAAIAEKSQAALDRGVAPDSAEGQRLLNDMIDPTLSSDDRDRLADQFATFTDRRVERYWSLLGVLNGWPQRPPMVPAMEWAIEALRAHG
jgi:DNA-binding transcriptional MerR regulator